MVVKEAQVVVVREVVVVVVVMVVVVVAVVVAVVVLLGYDRVSLAYQCGGGDGCSGTQLENGDARAVNAYTHTHTLLSGQKQRSYHYCCLLQLSWESLRLHPCWGEPPPRQHHP